MLRQCAGLFFLLLSVSSLLSADSKARIVRLSYVQGDVELDRGDGRGYVRAFANMPVIEGTRLWTRSDARVEIEFEDGGTLRLAPDSLIEFPELQLGERGEKITRIEIQQGIAYANLKDHDRDRLALAFAQQLLTLRHSSRFRIDLDKEQLKVAVFRGEIELQRHNAERVKVKKNETLAVELFDQERYYLSKGIAERAHDYWDREREEQRLVAESRRNAHVYPVSAVYGYDDLSPYGSWTLVPGYGWVWRPYAVSIGWDPFGYGAWVLYPRFGYVWISSHPWGWTPYRYGSWVFINRRGWCWRSGPQVNITNINIVNAPPTYHHPRPPVVNSGTIAIVSGGGMPRPADPRGDWMPRPRVPSDRRTLVTENEPPRVDRGRRALGSEDVRSPAAHGTMAQPAAGNPVAPLHRGHEDDDVADQERIATKRGINEIPLARTRDVDYDAVDYRRNPRSAVADSIDPRQRQVSNAGAPDGRDADREVRLGHPTGTAAAGPRTQQIPLAAAAPPPAASPQISRPAPMVREPREERPARPAYSPPRESPRSKPQSERSYSPPPMRSPAPAMAAPPPARPAPRSGRSSPRDR